MHITQGMSVYKNNNILLFQSRMPLSCSCAVMLMRFSLSAQHASSHGERLQGCWVICMHPRGSALNSLIARVMYAVLSLHTCLCPGKFEWLHYNSPHLSLTSLFVHCVSSLALVLSCCILSPSSPLLSLTLSPALPYLRAHGAPIAV